MKNTTPLHRSWGALALCFALSLQPSAQETPAAKPAATKPAALDTKAGLKSIRAKDIQAHVEFLASDELMGRHAASPGGKRAAEYIRSKVQAYGLEPFGDDGTFLQEVAGFAPNVVGIVRGSGKEFVLVTAHFDHLKPKQEGEDRIFNGADDNASGTAAVLELAQALGKQKGRLKASIVFVGFTAEEGGLRGSRYFVEHAPMELEAIRGVYNMDMISRGKKNLIFCEGGAAAPHLLETVKRANKTVKMDVRYGEHPEWISQSDQFSFIQKDVAALYFGVEDHEDYHRVSDHADKILPGLAAKVTQLVYLAATDLGSQE